MPSPHKSRSLALPLVTHTISLLAGIYLHSAYVSGDLAELSEIRSLRNQRKRNKVLAAVTVATILFSAVKLKSRSK